MRRTVSTKKGRSQNGYSGAAAAAVSHDPATMRIPNPTLPNTARAECAIAALDLPCTRTANAAARFMQSPDQASPPSASDDRCQPANRTPVAKIELMHPAATANHGRQREDETKSKLKASAVPAVSQRHAWWWSCYSFPC